jgi:hypothetical protein
MKVSGGVEMLELQVKAFGSRQELNPPLRWDDEIAMLIDRKKTVLTPPPPLETYVELFST